MLVKAKMNVRDANGWHMAGDVFHTDADFGDAVEVLDAPEPVKAEQAAEEPAEQPKPRTSTRRKTTTK